MTDEGITQRVWAHRIPIMFIEVRFNVVMRPRRVVAILKLGHEVHARRQPRLGAKTFSLSRASLTYLILAGPRLRRPQTPASPSSNVPLLQAYVYWPAVVSSSHQEALSGMGGTTWI